MTTELKLEILTWLSDSAYDNAHGDTLASLRITAGDLVITEVQDILAAHTVRDHINIPASLLAEWLLINWWRLRWEPQHENTPSIDWLQAHSLAAIGDGYAWPALVIASDGNAIRLRLNGEQPSNASVRFLHTLEVDVSLESFERAIDEFVQAVQGRIASRSLERSELGELSEELREERTDLQSAARCRLQAIAGFDPGAASNEWLEQAVELSSVAGQNAAHEVLAAAPTLAGGIDTASQIIQSMRESAVLVDLEWARHGVAHSASAVSSIPWVQASHLARSLRSNLGIGSGPIQTETLEDLLKVRFPLPDLEGANSKLLGGYRNGRSDQKTAILSRGQHDTSQRFYIARLIGAATVTAPSEHVLAVSRTYTAHQKFQRAFAQEFLCPWDALRDFIEVHGTDSEGVEEAAAHFNVSPLVVLTTLVNKGMLTRHSLGRSEKID